MTTKAKDPKGYYNRQRKLGRGLEDQGMTISEWRKAQGYDEKEGTYIEGND